MRSRNHSPEQIVRMLREADAKLAAGATVEQICKEFGVSDGTYYKWRKDYGRMHLDQVRHLKELQKENSRLKKLVADLSLDNAILKETVSGNY